MKEKSLRMNALLSGGQRLVSIIFPLVTFPYVSRVLQVDNIGKVNFSLSVISYFILIAELGIANYAIREGSILRDDKKKISVFANEVFSINLFSTLLSYLLLILFISFVPVLKSYRLLLYIQSITLIGSLFGVNWIYSIYEDYLYITVRALIIQLVSLVLMFLLVHKEEDYLIYAVIIVLATAGANVFNFIHARKYIKLNITYSLNLKRHFKPILIIFASSIAVSIYVNSDMTILGFLCGDNTVGLYSISVKIYTIVKQVLSAIIVVMLPRMSNYLANNQIKLYNKTVNKTFNILLVITLPLIIGIIMISKNIVLIMSGKSYVEASTSLSILCISLLFAILGSFVTYTILLPSRKEKIQLYATIISAIINIFFNFLIIPLWAENGAAFTTIIAEATVAIIELLAVRKIGKYRELFFVARNDIVGLLLGIVYVILCVSVIKQFAFPIIIETLFCILISAFGYFVLLKVCHHSIIEQISSELKEKFY